MTVIVGFAGTDLAFLAGDTLRRGEDERVTKLHVWSETVVFGQAGNGKHLGRAIAWMHANRHRYGSSCSELLRSFEDHRKPHFEAAEEANKKHPAYAHGTLLIAACGEGGPGELWTSDFAGRQLPQQVSHPVAAIGVGKADITARQKWPNTSPVPLDVWAATTINELVCEDVDWPIDFMIARRVGPDEWTNLRRRVRSGPINPSAEFVG